MSEKNDLVCLSPEVKTYVLDEVFDHALVKSIYKEIMDSRKCTGDDAFTYDTIEKTKDGKTYVIASRHVSVGECMRFSKSNCNKCYGTGRKMMEMDKKEIPNVQDFIMMASTPISGLSEEQKKIVIEREKAKKYWRILLPCPCTIKNMLKKNMQIVSNELNNIVIEITCTEKVME